MSAVRVIGFSRAEARPIDAYASIAAASVALGDGAGAVHVHCIHIDAGGSIGEHTAGFDQLLLVVEGSGWVSGADGRRVPLRSGQGALIRSGETHAKGSETGMIAIMVQADRLEPPGAAPE
ncbi:MAG TPA: cupin domain-containing protein [Candidatus Eisenbacteria bacterium]|nr:cupin domain-containing protein [Candidatus Eisenbacteria bacterium]